MYMALMSRWVTEPRVSTEEKLMAQITIFCKTWYKIQHCVKSHIGLTAWAIPGLVNQDAVPQYRVARNLLRNSAKKTATLKIVGKIESCQLPVNLNQELSGTVA
jgi:hypothetical protein